MPRHPKDLPPKKFITVRMPEALWEQLTEERWQNRISLNNLCLAKLSTPFTKLAPSLEPPVGG